MSTPPPPAITITAAIFNHRSSCERLGGGVTLPVRLTYRSKESVVPGMGDVVACGRVKMAR